MRGNKLLEKVTNIEEDLISEAANIKETNRREKKGGIVKFIALAACIWAIFGVIIFTQTDLLVKNNNKTSDSRQDMVMPGGNVLEGYVEETKAQEETTERFTESHSVEPYSSDEFTEPREIDINHDGTKELVYVAIHLPDGQVEIKETQEGSEEENILAERNYLEEIFGYYVYFDGTDNYLMSYEKQVEQDIANYEFDIFYLNAEGEQVVVDSARISFHPSRVSENFDINEMIDFYNKINGYLNKSYLLVGNVSGEIQYSDGDALIQETEEYDFMQKYDIDYSNCTNMQEKLETYFQFVLEKERVLSSQYSGNEYIIMTVEQNTITSTGASFNITNYGMEEAGGGEYYKIQRLEKDLWVDCDTIGEVSFIEIGWVLQSGIPWKFDLDWSENYGTLQSGSYRLVKEVDGKEIYCEFQIN